MKRRIAFRIIAVGSLSALLAVLTFYFSAQRYNPSPRYPNFGIPMPANYAIHGIDVSRYQQEISWSAVSAMTVAGVRPGFVFIKATSSDSLQDPFFSSNYVAAKNAGLIVGAYHFFDPDADGIAQAKNFDDHAIVEVGDLPPVLDIETTGRTSLEDFQQHISDFLQTIEKKYGVQPIIYSNIYFYQSFLSQKFGRYPLWIANYFADDRPRLQHDWLFWQHSSLGNVNGIQTKTDFDVFNGDSADFRSILLK